MRLIFGVLKYMRSENERIKIYKNNFVWVFNLVADMSRALNEDM
jgi:hypothetical protein